VRRSGLRSPQLVGHRRIDLERAPVTLTSAGPNLYALTDVANPMNLPAFDLGPQVAIHLLGLGAYFTNQTTE
jgi:hypothetical protein